MWWSSRSAPGRRRSGRCCGGTVRSRGSPAQPDDLVDRLADVAAHAARHEAVSHAVTPESTAAVDDEGYPVLWGIAWRARSASWIARHRPMLRRAITA